MWNSWRVDNSFASHGSLTSKYEVKWISKSAGSKPRFWQVDSTTAMNVARC